MDALDTLITGRIPSPAGIATGEVPVWNGSAWVRSSVTNISASSIATPFTFTSYAPAWTSTGTAPAIGDGTLTGQYIQVGKLVVFQAAAVFGSTTTFGTGNYRLSLPVTAAQVGRIWGMAAQNSDASPATTFQLFATGITTTTVAGLNDAGVGAGQTAPITWANGDTFRLAGVYEAA